MSLRSCSLPGRVFRVPQQCRLLFPEDNMQAINAYAALLRAATFRQVTQISGSTDSLRPGER